MWCKAHDLRPIGLGQGSGEGGMGNSECGNKKRRAKGIECGFRPVGDIGACAPEGSGNAER